MTDFLKKYPLAVFVFLYGLGLAAYFPILNNALVSDDYFFVIGTGNMPLSEVWRVFTLLSPYLLRPLPILVWWFQIHLFGGEGLPSHIIDIFFHAGAAFMLFMLMSRYCCATLTALAASVLFVLAPVGPDAVTWSAARMDTMGLLFVLLAIFLYLGYLKSGSRYVYAGFLLAGAGALLSKEAALVVVLLVPATEALFGGEAPKNSASRKRREGAFSTFRIKAAAARQIPFFLMFIGYIVFRWAILGGLGGYTNLIGIPGARATRRSIWTFLSPLNDQIFSREKIVIFGLMTVFLWTASTFFVIFNWRREAAPRRLWLFFAFFTLVSPLPVFWFFFVVGLNHSMLDSRFLYFPTLPFIAMTVLGLVEFGPKIRFWRPGVMVLLAFVALVYLWGLQWNNRLWEHASDVVTTVSDETIRLVPDPDPNSSIYYEGLGQGLGVHIFGTNLQQLIHWKYGRQDLRVSRLEPEIESRRDAPIYFFIYDDETDQLQLTDTLPPLGAP